MFKDQYSLLSVDDLAACEEMRCSAMKEGTEDLACWASQIMGHCDEFCAVYCQTLISGLFDGAGAAEIVGRVQRDLSRARHSERAAEVALVFALSINQAYKRCRDAPRERGLTDNGWTAPRMPHPHGFWGWSL